MNADPLLDRCRDLVAEIGLAEPGDVRAATPLTGGVASDIALVDLGARKVCVKFALGKLKVAEDWRAPVHRNRAEYAWLEFARSVAPRNAPELYGRSEALNGFAMEHVTGEDVYLWKSALLAEAPDRGEAEAVGHALGRIHAASTRPGFDRSPFGNRDDFHALRLEPYLVFTAGRHPQVAARLNALVADLYASDTRAGAWRRQPQEHPDARRRAGPARRGMRDDGRSVLRRRVLSQPSGAQIAAPAGIPRRSAAARGRFHGRVCRSTSTGSRPPRSTRGSRRFFRR